MRTRGFKGLAKEVRPGSVLRPGSGGGNELSRDYCRRPSGRLLRRRGVVLIWTALLVMVMILFVGLSIDAGKLALNVHQLQNAADAAALAGALYVKTETADFTRQKACAMGFQNAAEHLAVTLRAIPTQPATFPTNANGSYDYSSYDTVVGRWVRTTQTFVPTLDAPNAVKVIARRNTALAGIGAPAFRFLWGPIVGVRTADAAATSIGFCNSSNGAGLIVLSNDPTQTLDMGGGPIIDLDGGGIHVNSTSMQQSNPGAGARVQQNTVLDAGFLNVVGTVDPEPDDPLWQSIFANAAQIGETGGFPIMDHSDGIQPIADPLATDMLSDPYAQQYVVQSTKGGARLNLPGLIQGPSPIIPTRYVKWDSGSSTYVPAGPGDPCDTVGLGTTVTIDPTTGQPVWTSINPGANVTLQPGYYPNGMTIQNGDTITLQPDPALGFLGNVFIFGGGQNPSNNNIGLYMTGGNLIAPGATCYVTQTFDSTGSPLPTPVDGLIEITGGHLDIDSPGDWYNQQHPPADMSLVEGLNGIAIWQDPDMPSTPNVHLRGNGDFHISGTIYLPDPVHMILEGDLGDTGNQILCGSALIRGTAALHVNYDGRNEGNSPTQVCLVQ
jgi:Flp pilus assembly protein TadG